MRDLLTSVDHQPLFEDFDLMLNSILTLSKKADRTFEGKIIPDALEHS